MMASTTTPISASSHRPSRLLFGSCNSQDYPQPLWSEIRQRNASAFVWVGDAVYGDFKTFYPHKMDTVVTPATIDKLHNLYVEQRKHVNYSQILLDDDLYIYGVFDDHDYGVDNGDKTFSIKRESAIEFVETFLQMPPQSPMTQRARKGEGVYGVKLFDFSRPAGQELLQDEEAMIDPDVVKLSNNTNNHVPSYSTSQSVAVFVIDIRTHKTPYVKKGYDKYFDNNEGDFLGDLQWQWLEQALANSNATINVVGNGLQVHADKYSDPNVGEAWPRFPKAQERLYQTLMQHSTRPAILISGDVHLAELGQKNCYDSSATAHTNPRAIVEMTTSGLTHSWGVNFCSSPSPICEWWYTAWATRQAMTIGHFINPWTELIYLDQTVEPGTKKGLQYSLELNFGELEFDWEQQQIMARVHGVDGPIMSVAWNFSDLASSSSNHVVANNNWTCINHRGTVNPYHAIATQVLSVSILAGFALLPAMLTLLTLVLSIWYLVRRRNRKRY